jgi:hypothetical protein
MDRCMDNIVYDFIYNEFPSKGKTGETSQWLPGVGNENGNWL